MVLIVFSYGCTKRIDDNSVTRIIEIENNTSLTDFARVINDWGLIREAILLRTPTGCIKEGDFTVDNINYFQKISLEKFSLKRLNQSSNDLHQNLDEKTIESFFGMSFIGICGYRESSTNVPFWTVFSSKGNYYFYSYEQLLE